MTTFRHRIWARQLLLWVESSPPHWSGLVAVGGTTHSRREVQHSNPLLTLAVAPDAEPDVDFLARTVSTPAVG
jgi:hypothetical protein